jgi:hypothetical protein
VPPASSIRSRPRDEDDAVAEAAVSIPITEDGEAVAAPDDRPGADERTTVDSAGASAPLTISSPTVPPASSIRSRPRPPRIVAVGEIAGPSPEAVEPAPAAETPDLVAAEPSADDLVADGAAGLLDPVASPATAATAAAAAALAVVARTTPRATTRMRTMPSRRRRSRSRSPRTARPWPPRTTAPAPGPAAAATTAAAAAILVVVRGSLLGCGGLGGLLDPRRGGPERRRGRRRG